MVAVSFYRQSTGHMYKPRGLPVEFDKRSGFYEEEKTLLASKQDIFKQ